MTEKRILIDEARSYVASKPFVNGDSGCFDWLEFNPPVLETQKTLLDQVSNSMAKKQADGMNKFLPGLGSMVKSSKNIYPLFIEGSAKNPGEIEEYWLTKVGLVLTEPFGEQYFENALYLQNPELAQKAYIDFRLRQRLATKLVHKYGLLFENSDFDSGLIVCTPEIQNLSEIDNLLAFGLSYNEIINSDLFISRIRGLEAEVESHLDLFDQFLENQL